MTLRLTVARDDHRSRTRGSKNAREFWLISYYKLLIGINMAKNGDVSIFGSCVVRSSFNYAPLNTLKVGEYIHKISPLFSEPVPVHMMINEDEVRSDHNFIKRSICTLLNGTAWIRLDNNWSDWLIMDNLYFSCSLYLLEGPNKERRLLQFPLEVESEVFRIVAENPKYTGWKITKLSACPNYKLLIKQLIEHLHRWNLSKIILIDAVDALWKIDETGKRSEYHNNPDFMIMRSMITKMLLDNIDIVYYICPSELYADYYNGFGFCNVHYGSEIYEYYSNILYNRITEKGNDLLVQSKATSVLQNQLCLIINEVVYSSSNTIGRLKRFYEKDGNTDDTIDVLINLSNNVASNYSNYECEAWLGRIYRDGKGVDRNLMIASEWTRKANMHGGPIWAKSDLFDILWRINTPESISEALDFGMPLAKAGVKELQYWVARCYRDGKGVEKDLDKAAEWMRKAKNQGLKWADGELFGILWRINTPESMFEALEFGMPLAESGVKELQGWIARCYREGRGVEKDLDKATEWMRKAYDQKLGYASWELFDILWRIDTPESLKEAISIVESLAQSGNRELQGRMGRAYRDGKGVEKNLDIAREWFKKAADQNLAWAKKELADLDNHQA